MTLGRALPGVVLLGASCVLLALVSFNTPLIKNFYFLEGKFESGNYAGSIRLGTLGYCLEQSGGTTCVGPQVGYSFDLNTILGVSNRFNIPTAVSKYLTYVLILHIIALGLAAIALVLVMFEMIPGFSLLCFPTCFASMAGSIALIAFVFDLAIFYIAKAAIDRVDGASATIGAAVWMTLAGWLCAGFSICAMGLGNCCCGDCGRGNRDRSRDRRRKREEEEDYRRDEDMRLDAIRHEHRRQKEQGLPNFEQHEHERVPLKQEGDQYMYDDGNGNVTSNLRRNGSAVTGVGVGYGRRAPGPAAAYAAGLTAGGLGAGGVPQRRPSVQSSVIGFGQAGVGAGGVGIDQPQNRYNDYDNEYGYDQQGTERFNDNNDYYDPYQNPDGYNQQDPYQAANPLSPTGAYDPYAGNPAYPPVAAAAAVTSPTHRGQQEYYAPAPLSSDSHYQDPGPHVQHAPHEGYYEDDGLGAIGRAAQSPTGDRQYTGQQGYSAPQIAPIAVPTPQRLVQPQSATSPVSEYPSEPSMYDRSQSQYTYETEGEGMPRPPSYGTVAGPPQVSANRYAAAAPSAYPPEKHR